MRTHRFRYLAWGALLALGAPVGWLLLSSWLGDPGGGIWLYVYLTLSTLIAFASFGYTLGSKQDALARLAAKDALTGLVNQAEFMRTAELLLALSEREWTPLTIVMIDIDYFKQVNDDYGHLVGNEIIKEVASILEECTRRSDVVARFGGDEFAICLPHTGRDTSEMVSERIRERVQENAFEISGNSIRITLSLGVSEYDGKSVTTVGGMTESADRALYRAKQEGRNRVCFRNA